jgi:UDP:flavonoid glycosyltransferase YjiC (YdhE family)
MARILVVTFDSGGNVPPMLGIAGELLRRGHQVRVLGHPQQREVVVSAGLKFIDYRHARPWSPKVAASGARFLLRFLFGIFTDPRLGNDVRDELVREPVDLALVDSMILAGVRAAERAGLPTAVLMHTFHRYHIHEWSRGPIGVIAALRGMRPGRLWNAADRVLVATDSALDPSAERRLPANVRYTGVVQAPIQPGAPEDKPLVLVSLSTIFFEGQEETLQAILDALETLPIRGVVTTGAVAPGALRVPANVEGHQYLPHDDIMPSASLVVGHGGHSTTMRALAHGIPLLILPMHRILDQPMIGKAVAAAGAGRVLPKTASAEEIRSAVRSLLQNPSYRQAAGVVSARLRSRNGAIAAADELESLLKAPRCALPSPAAPSGRAADGESPRRRSHTKSTWSSLWR